MLSTDTDTKNVTYSFARYKLGWTWIWIYKVHGSGPVDMMRWVRLVKAKRQRSNWILRMLFIVSNSFRLSKCHGAKHSSLLILFHSIKKLLLFLPNSSRSKIEQISRKRAAEPSAERAMAPEVDGQEPAAHRGPHPLHLLQHRLVVVGHQARLLRLFPWKVSSHTFLKSGPTLDVDPSHNPWNFSEN